MTTRVFDRDFISIFVSAACEGRRHTTIKSASAFLLTFRTWTLLNHREELKLMLALFYGAGIPFIFLCRQSKALNVDEQSLSAFFVF